MVVFIERTVGLTADSTYGFILTSCFTACMVTCCGDCFAFFKECVTIGAIGIAGITVVAAGFLEVVIYVGVAYVVVGIYIAVFLITYGADCLVFTSSFAACMVTCCWNCFPFFEESFTILSIGVTCVAVVTAGFF